MFAVVAVVVLLRIPPLKPLLEKSQVDGEILLYVKTKGRDTYDLYPLTCPYACFAVTRRASVAGAFGCRNGVVVLLRGT